MSEDTAAADTDVEIKDNPSAHRYEAYVDGSLVGQLDYRRSDGRITMPHTEVNPRYEGRGIGGRLAHAALDAAVEAGEVIVPDCPFVAEYVRRHPDFLEHVDEASRAALTKG